MARLVLKRAVPIGGGMYRRDAIGWLEREDREGRADRLERLEWTARSIPISEYLTFPGGWMAKQLFEEARYCFIYGQFLATIVLGLAYIEHTLAALLYGEGRSDLERGGMSVLIGEAVDNGWLTQEEFKNLDHARTLRNPVTHFRRPFHEGSIEHRAVTLDQPPYSILEEDARHVMSAVFRLLARQAA